MVEIKKSGADLGLIPSDVANVRDKYYNNLVGRFLKCFNFRIDCMFGQGLE